MAKSHRFLQNLIKPFLFKTSKDPNELDLEQFAAQEQKEFSFEALAAATKNFHPTLKLGEGGFGPVFKGKLDDGREIAVKKLSQSSTQGKKAFQRECKLLARVQHRNVVNLFGYCVHGEEQLLVYQYVANESLDKLLFNEEPHGREVFSWKRRYEIILGIAKGLLYLHQEAHCRIIHRDIKASNILLDEKWVPKIADFGMARLFPEGETHVNTRVAGTNGYMAPEYVMHGYLSEKADVFSFGVVVLELISGQKNLKSNRDPQTRNMLEWAYKLFKKNRSMEMVDPKIASLAESDQIARCIQVGLLCVQSDPKSRPNMSRVVVILSKPSILEEPQRPGYPGSRYRVSRHPTASSSSSSVSGSFHISQSFEAPTSSTSHTVTQTSLSVHRNPRLDDRGKRPMTDY